MTRESRSRRRLALGTVLATIVLGFVFVATPSQAAFPGADGRIAFVTIAEGGQDIATMEPDGSDVIVLTHMSSGHYAGDPEWSADGSTIAFDRESFHKGNARSQLWAMNADGSDQHPLLRDPFYADYSPSFSPDGATIVFVRCRPDVCAIYRMNSDGSGLDALTHFKSSVSDEAPRYSPDGATIAFDSLGRGGIQWAVYLMNPDGSHVRRLTPKGLIASGPDWSPDGSQIVFSTHCCARRTTAEVWVINTDGTGLNQVTSPGESHDWYPAFSPQGDRITFVRYSPEFDRGAIWVVNADGTDRVKIHRNPAFLPVWGTTPVEAS
jgi:Tol biopolymer transport system component